LRIKEQETCLTLHEHDDDDDDDGVRDFVYCAPALDTTVVIILLILS
jgi:hypothetical protein